MKLPRVLRFILLASITVTALTCLSRWLVANNQVRQIGENDPAWQISADGHTATIRPNYRKELIRGLEVTVILDGREALSCRVLDNTANRCSYKSPTTGAVIALEWHPGEPVHNFPESVGQRKPLRRH